MERIGWTERKRKKKKKFSFSSSNTRVALSMANFMRGCRESCVVITVTRFVHVCLTPRFLFSFHFLLEGHGGLQEILTVNATDDDFTEDNSRIRYYLLQPVKGFTVHPSTGVLTVNRTAIPRPLPKEVELTIVAEDHGKPSASATCSVVVRLSSLKNTLPGREYKINAKENSSRGKTLMRLSDVDLLDGAIVAGDETGVFEVSRGRLILAKPLDREMKDM